jgi:hypothetical protein
MSEGLISLSAPTSVGAYVSLLKPPKVFPSEYSQKGSPIGTRPDIVRPGWRVYHPVRAGHTHPALATKASRRSFLDLPDQGKIFPDLPHPILRK